jgi:hypothetical protein
MNVPEIKKYKKKDSQFPDLLWTEFISLAFVNPTDFQKW